MSSLHVPFDPNSVDWREFFEIQHGGGYYFEGLPYQRGGGIGSVFSTLIKYLLPLGKSIGRELSKEGIDTGARILSRLSEGQNLKHTLADESKRGLKNLVDRVYKPTTKQKGTGRRNTIKRVKSSRKKQFVFPKQAHQKELTILVHTSYHFVIQNVIC